MPRSPSPPRSRSRTPLSRSPSPGPPEQDDACPFLIRMYVTKGRHTPLRDFDDGRLPSQDEYHVYGWKDSTPTSLVQQLYAVLPAPYRSPVARYSFKHVYVDASPAGLYKAKEIISFSGRDFVATVAPALGGTSSGTANGDGGAMDRALGDDAHDAHARRGHAITDEETLDEMGFLKGDLLSVAVDVPGPRAGGGGNRAQGSGAPRRPSGPDGLRNGTSGPTDRYAPPHRDARAPRDPPPHRDREWGRRGPAPAAPGGGWRDRDRDRGWGRRSPDWNRRSRSPDDRRGSWSRGRN